MQLHNLLSNLLKVRKIRDVTELTEEERTTFANYERILNKTKVTIDDFENFLKTQIATIEMKWQDLSMPATAKAELLPYHTVYNVLLKVIGAPDTERKNLEDYLTQIIKSHESK